MNKNNTVRQAGGFIIQLMPFTGDEIIEKLENRIAEIDSVTMMLERGLTPEGILEEILGDFGLEITDKFRQHLSVTVPRSGYPAHFRRSAKKISMTSSMMGRASR